MANRKAKKRQKSGKKKATDEPVIGRRFGEDQEAETPKPTAKKLEVLRVEPVPEFPNKHLVVLTIEDPPTLPPEIPAEMFPVVIEPTAIRDNPITHLPTPPPAHTLWTWLKGLWG
jgi:hypothetical protein